MRYLRPILVALVLTLAATAAFAVSAKGATAASSCVSADYCFCLEIDCYMGSQLCASGPSFTCYQPAAQ